MYNNGEWSYDDNNDNDQSAANNKNKQKRSHASIGIQLIDASIDPTSQPNSMNEHNILQNINNHAPPSPEITSGNLQIRGAYVPGHGYLHSGDHTNDICSLSKQDIQTNKQFNQSNNSGTSQSRQQNNNQIQSNNIQSIEPQLTIDTAATNNQQTIDESHTQPITVQQLRNITSSTAITLQPTTLNKQSSMPVLQSNDIISDSDIKYRAWVAESPDGKCMLRFYQL